MAEAVSLTAEGALAARMPLGEMRLARLAAAGDERAFAAIFERYHQELYRYCRAILGDPDEAQDALQNTMASALRALPGESRRIALRPWLYRVARNEAITLIRRRTDGVSGEEALPPAPSVDASAETRERLRELMSDLAALPERQRSALVMRELGGLTHRQIAAVLDVSAGAARQAVYEARSALADLQEGREMTCDEARRVVSQRDGRILRGRRIRAHLRACEGCSDFRAGIATRRADLAALAPPLPATAASGVLASVLGGGSAKLGTGALGGLLGGAGGATGLGAKSLSVLAASAAVGFGAAGVSGTIELPGTGAADAGRDSALGHPPAAGAPADPHGRAHSDGAPARTKPGDAAANPPAGADRRRPEERGNRSEAGGASPGTSAAEGREASAAQGQAPADPGAAAAPAGHEASQGRVEEQPAPATAPAPSPAPAPAPQTSSREPTSGSQNGLLAPVEPRAPLAADTP